MGTVRVTQGMLVTRVLSNLRDQSLRILNLQTQLSTQRRVNAPSDNPIDARRAIGAQAIIARNEQYLNVITSIGPQLSETDTSVQTVINDLRRARELTIQAASTTNTQPQLDAIALEINQILENVFQTSNHITNDRYIFAGTRTSTAAFSAARDANGDITAVTFEGNSESIDANVADGVTIETNLTGDYVFQSNADVFEVLRDIRDNMRTSNFSGLQDRLSELTTSQTQLLSSLSRIGSRENRLDRISEDMDSYTLQLQEVLSETIDADLADVIVNLNAQTNAYTAALNSAARVIQPSLLDFVR